MKHPYFYTVFGYLTCAFAEMEADLRLLIAGVAFNDNSVTAAAFLDGSQLNANISILRRLGKQYWDHDASFADIAQRVERLRPVRNLFIHGLWEPEKDAAQATIASVRDLKTSYEEDPTSRKWIRGQEQSYSLADFNGLLKDIGEVNSRIAKLCAALEKDEDLSFSHFGAVTKGKPMRMRIEKDGSWHPSKDGERS